MCFMSRELLAGWPQMARGLRCIFGALSRAPGERWRMHLGPQILLEAGGLLLSTAQLLRRMRRRQVYQALRGAAHAVVPAEQRGNGCSSKCTKARGGCKRRRELSWRQLEQRAGRHDSRASASAPTAAADGRKVLSDDRGAPSVV